MGSQDADVDALHWAFRQAVDDVIEGLLPGQDPERVQQIRHRRELRDARRRARGRARSLWFRR